MPRLNVHPWLILLGAILLPWMARADAPVIMPILDASRGEVDAPLVEAVVAPKAGLFATLSRELGLRLWNATQGEPTARQLPHGLALPPRVSALALSEDGVLLAVAGPDPASDGKRHVLQIIDLSQGKVRAQLDGGGGALHTMAFSPDARALATLAWGEEGLRFYDSHDGSLLGVDRSYASEGYALDYAPDGTLATASLDGVIRLYDPRAQRVARTEPTPHSMPTTLDFSPDGKELAVGYAAGRAVSIFSGMDLTPVYRTPEVAGGTLSAVAWSGDGSTLYAGGRWKEKEGFLLRAWDGKGRGAGRDHPVGDEPIARLFAHGAETYILGRMGRLWRVGASEGVRTVWRPLTLAGGAVVAEPHLLLSREGWEVQFSLRQAGETSRPLRFSLRDLELREGSAVTGKTLERPGEPLAGEALPSGQVWRAGEGMVRVDERGAMTLLHRTAAGWTPTGAAHPGPWGPMALSPDGRWVAGVQLSPPGGVLQVVVLETRGGGGARARLSLEGEGVHALALSPDGRHLAVSRWGSGGVALYGTEKGERTGEDRAYAAEGHLLSFAPDGRLAVAGLDGYLRLYGPSLTLEGRAPLPGDGMPVALAFSPDGRSLAVGWGTPPAVMVWEVATMTAQPSLRAEGALGLSALGWSGEGRVLLAGGRVKEGARLWRWSGGKEAMPTLPMAAPVLGLQPVSGGKVATRLANRQWVILEAAMTPTTASLVVMEAEGGGLRGPETAALEVSEGGGKVSWRGVSLPLEMGENVQAHAFGRDKGVVLVGTEWRLLALGGAQILWDRPVPGSVRAVNLSGNGAVVVAALADRTVRWYDAVDGRERAALYPEPLRREWVVWSPEGRYVASPLGGRLAGVVRSGKSPGETVFRSLDALPMVEKDGAWLKEWVAGGRILYKGRR